MVGNARTRVIVATVLLLAGLGGVVAAWILLGDWLPLLTYITGSAAAWHLFGSLMAFAQARRAQALNDITSSPAGRAVVDGLRRWAAQQPANAADTTTDIEPTNQEGAQP